MPGPWHDDIPIDQGYKGATIVDKKTADALYELEQGHWIDNGRWWTRAEYAYRAANKIITPDYFLLVKIITRNAEGERVIAWAVIILSQTVETTFPST
jgi:hypothetical protein